MGYLRHLATLGGDLLPHAAGIADIEVIWFSTTPYVFAGAMSDGGVNRLVLHSDRVAELVQVSYAGQFPEQLALDNLSLVTLGGQAHLLGLGRLNDPAVLRQLDGASGQIGASVGFDAPADQLSGWAQAVSVTVGGRDHLVVARHDAPGLWVYEVNAGHTLTLRDAVADSAKVALGGVSDLVTVNMNGETFVIAASSTQSGVSSHRLHPDGRIEHIDSFGAHVGAGLAQSTALITTEVLGETYVVVASAGSGTLTSLRLNDHGVMFEADHKTDTLQTRFGGVQDMAGFSHEGRSFVLAGGSDDGLSLFEIGPGGQLYHLQSLAHQAGWTLQKVRAIEATVVEGQAIVFVSGEVATGMTQFSIDLGRFGEVIMAGPGDTELNGSVRDDHLEAGADDVILRGGGGNDRLVAGTGETRLWGGPGEDVFVFRPGGGVDRIMDFEHGLDRIDLSAYPMLYSTAALSFESTHTGARIRLGDDVIVVRTHDLMPLSSEDFTQSDFIFG